MKYDFMQAFKPVTRLLMQWSDELPVRDLSPQAQANLIAQHWVQVNEALTDLYLQTSDYLFGPDPTRFTCVIGLAPLEMREESDAVVEATQDYVQYVTELCAALDMLLQRPSVTWHVKGGLGAEVPKKMDLNWGPIKEVREARLTRLYWTEYFNEQAVALLARVSGTTLVNKGGRNRTSLATHLAVPLQSQLPYNPHNFKIVSGARSLSRQFMYVPVPQLVEAARSYAATWYELNGVRLTNSHFVPSMLERVPLKPEVWMLSHLEPNAQPQEIDRLARQWCVLLGVGALSLNQVTNTNCTCLKCYAPKLEDYNFIHFMNGIELAYRAKYLTVKYNPKAPHNPFIDTQPKSDALAYNEGVKIILDACVSFNEQPGIPF